MSRVESRASTWFVFVGARSVEVALRRGQRWVDGSFAETPVEATSPDALADAIRALGERVRRAGGPLGTAPTGHLASLRVVVADVWLAEATLTWSDAMKTRAGAEASAREQLAFAGYADDVSDPVVVDDAGYGRPRLVVGYPALIWVALQELATLLRSSLASVLPASVIAWHHLRRSTGPGSQHAIGLVDEAFVLVASGAERVENVAARSLESVAESPGAALDSLRRQWVRTKARDPRIATIVSLPMLSLLSEAQGEVSSDQSDLSPAPLELPAADGGSTLSSRLRFAALAGDLCLELDPVSRLRAASTLQRFVAIASFAVLSLFVWHAWQTGVRAGELARDGQLIQTTVFESKALTWERDELRRVRAVNVAVGELNVPVFALLAALVPPRDLSVFVLSVDIASSAQGEPSIDSVKIVAEAATVEDMTRYVSYVADHKPFTAAVLVRHELAEVKQPPSFRFTVDATWPR